MSYSEFSAFSGKFGRSAVRPVTRTNNEAVPGGEWVASDERTNQGNAEGRELKTESFLKNEATDLYENKGSAVAKIGNEATKTRRQSSVLSFQLPGSETRTKRQGAENRETEN